MSVIICDFAIPKSNHKIKQRKFITRILSNCKYGSLLNRVSSQRKSSTSVRHHRPRVDKMSLLRYSKRLIPTPKVAGVGSKETEAANKEAGVHSMVTEAANKEAGVGSKETEAANKEAEKLQTITRKRKRYLTS